MFRRKRPDDEVAKELEAHIAHEADELIARGVPPGQARNSARKRLGNPTLILERAYYMHHTPWFEALKRDLHYAIRQLRSSPGFTITAILSLALGIGANTAIFQLIDSVRLRSLPVQKPQELAEVKLIGGTRGFGVSNGAYEATYPLWEQIRDHQQPFSSVFAWGANGIPYGEGVNARAIRGMWLSGDAFRTLGVVPYRGQLFTADQDKRGCGTTPGVILSHGFWQREFGGQDKAVGSKITLNNQPFQIVGVTPPEFFGLEVGRTFDIAMLNCSLSLWGNGLEARHFWSHTVIGRLKPDWTLARAAEYFRNASPAWFDSVPPNGYDSQALKQWHQFRYTAEPGGNGVSFLRRQYERSLWLLLGITMLVLIIACANLANLQLARASARDREFAVRLALGASRGRLISLLLSEGLLLASAGALAGILLARWFTRGILWFIDPTGKELLLNLSLDWRVMAFTAAAAVLTCVLFGLTPALRASRSDVASAMKAGGRNSSADRSHFSFQRLLITCQIAVSVVLLVGALLFTRSFRNLMTVDTGFKQVGIIFNFIDLGPLKPPRDQIRALQSEVLQKVSAIPGVRSAAMCSHVPLNGSSWSLGIDVPGHAGEGKGSSQFTWISPHYLSTMGIRLLAGRDFDLHDTEKSRKVVLVNETFVKKIFDGEMPVGKTFRSLAEPGYEDTTYEVVGVVSDTKYSDLRSDIPPIAYAPELQNPQWGPFMPLVVSADTPAATAMSDIRKELALSWPALRMRQLHLRDAVQEGLVRERMLAWLSGFFGVLAAIIAMIGLYGVISYMTARRRNEIGIRLALGARPSGVVALVFRQILTPVVLGTIAGAVLAVALARTASTLLFDLKPTDPLTFGIAIAVLTLIAIAASLAPAVRASHLNPLTTLREE